MKTKILLFLVLTGMIISGCEMRHKHPRKEHVAFAKCQKLKNGDYAYHNTSDDSWWMFMSNVVSDDGTSSSPVGKWQRVANAFSDIDFDFTAPVKEVRVNANQEPEENQLEQENTFETENADIDNSNSEADAADASDASSDGGGGDGGGGDGGD